MTRGQRAETRVEDPCVVYVSSQLIILIELIKALLQQVRYERLLNPLNQL